MMVTGKFSTDQLGEGISMNRLATKGAAPKQCVPASHATCAGIRIDSRSFVGGVGE